MLSTIILNWNRADLLRMTVESYLATASCEKELFIIDNASSDESREYLRRLEQSVDVKVIYLDENAGGEAFNLAIPLARGDLIHLSGNDQVFLSGWVEHVISAFDVFSDLGQLSLFSDTPVDTEAWAPKPSHLRFARGKILYEAHANVGGSSILRPELFREHGIKIKNLEHGKLRFPDDGSLSADVKAAGYWVAWSERYYVRNVGHEVQEFDARPKYYEENYTSKPWLGIEGWQERIAKQRSTPKPIRLSVAFPEREAIPEKTPPDVQGKPARLWSMFDGRTAEVEVLDFFFALTRLVKPAHVLETGTWLGLSGCAIAHALVMNGFGRLTTLEVNPEAHAVAQLNFKQENVERVVCSLLQSSMDFTPQNQFEMALFDSAIELRIAEFRRFRPWLTNGATVIFHDTAAHHQMVIAGVNELVKEGYLVGIDLPTPRGIFVGRVTLKNMPDALETRLLSPEQAKTLAAGAAHYRAFVGPPDQYDFMGATQFGLLTALGLREDHRLLDFGCGSLRAGRLLIPYLLPSRYYGLEPAHWLIEDAIDRELGREIIAIKQPVFRQDEDFKASHFNVLFDFILAQSIFSHAGRDVIVTALKDFRNCLNIDGLILATFIQPHQLGGASEFAGTGWVYPGCVAYELNTVNRLITEAGMTGRVLPWFHPRQTWFVIAHSEDQLPQLKDDVHLSGQVVRGPPILP
jgi:predicted O-methyltransferase YrrM